MRRKAALVTLNITIPVPVRVFFFLHTQNIEIKRLQEIRIEKERASEAALTHLVLHCVALPRAIYSYMTVEIKISKGSLACF